MFNARDCLFHEDVNKMLSNAIEALYIFDQNKSVSIMLFLLYANPLVANRSLSMSTALGLRLPV